MELRSIGHEYPLQCFQKKKCPHSGADSDENGPYYSLTKSATISDSPSDNKFYCRIPNNSKLILDLKQFILRADTKLSEGRM
jgi:hypothetical protein